MFSDFGKASSQSWSLKRSGGRRYYRTEDIQLLKSIKSLLYDEGYTIKGAQNSLKKRTFPSESVQTKVANQPSSAMRQSVTEAHLHKADLCWKS